VSREERHLVLAYKHALERALPARWKLTHVDIVDPVPLESEIGAAWDEVDAAYLECAARSCATAAHRVRESVERCFGVVSEG
jgi:hypothetical protein